jgi:hypothetical protein
VVSGCPPTVFAYASASEYERLRVLLQARWRSAVRALTVLQSLHGRSVTQIPALMECDPATVCRWIGSFHTCEVTGLDDRVRCGRPRLGGGSLTATIAALLERPGPWTLPRLYRYLGRSKSPPAPSGGCLPPSCLLEGEDTVRKTVGKLLDPVQLHRARGLGLLPRLGALDGRRHGG